jgi:hypothetical protein
MAKVKTGKSAGREKIVWFPGMEPPKIRRIESAIERLESCRAAEILAVEERKTAESLLSRAMHDNVEQLEKDAGGHPRYLSKALRVIAVLKTRESREVVSLKKAPEEK